MSALAMILTAAMMVPGDGPEKVSGEIVRSTQPLDLKGQWKAVVYHHGLVCEGKAVVDERGALAIPFTENHRVVCIGKPEDEGGGNLKMQGYLGIYQQDGDRLRICVNWAERKRPTSFHAEDGLCLIILHRVKSRK